MSGVKDNHGQTPAAWTAVGIMTLGTLVSTIGVCVAQPWLFWVGLGVVALGLVVGKLMQMAGLGAVPKEIQERREVFVAEGDGEDSTADDTRTSASSASE